MISCRVSRAALWTQRMNNYFIYGLEHTYANEIQYGATLKQLCTEEIISHFAYVNHQWTLQSVVKWLSVRGKQTHNYLLAKDREPPLLSKRLMEVAEFSEHWSSFMIWILGRTLANNLHKVRNNGFYVSLHCEPEVGTRYHKSDLYLPDATLLLHLCWCSVCVSLMQFVFRMS